MDIEYILGEEKLRKRRNIFKAILNFGFLTIFREESGAFQPSAPFRNCRK